MRDSDYVIGERVDHPVHGGGTIVFVGAEYLGIDFDLGGNVLIRRSALQVPPPAAEAVRPTRAGLIWPESTFEHEIGVERQSMWLRFHPLMEDPAELYDRISEIAMKSLDQVGYINASFDEPTVPDDWPRGYLLVWPLRVRGLCLVIAAGDGPGSIVSVFPFYRQWGTQCEVTLDRVVVRENGLEAQIVATWGETTIRFYETEYLFNRGWYAAGRQYEFVLHGVVYDAAPATIFELTFDQHPDVVSWINETRPPGAPLEDATRTINLAGSAMLLPLQGADADDYQFRGPVKRVRECDDWLGQSGWEVSVTVIRTDEEDKDLNIVITRRAWGGDKPPAVGQDIDGRLWLQGHLVRPVQLSLPKRS